jgi:hypothetical protein
MLIPRDDLTGYGGNDHDRRFAAVQHLKSLPVSHLFLYDGSPCLHFPYRNRFHDPTLVLKLKEAWFKAQ